MNKSIIVLILLALGACSHNRDVKRNISDTSRASDISGYLIADTIIYDVIIRSTDPDDAWSAECLKGLQRTGLIDSLFNMVYEGRVTAYDFDTHQPLRVNDIRLIEKKKGFSRERIGKIQFKERWYLDPSGIPLKKEIISIVLGYEVYTSTNELMGYKPVFQLNFN